jgi:hypothetical protein
MSASVCAGGRRVYITATGSVDKSYTDASQYQRYIPNNKSSTRIGVLDVFSPSVVSPMNISDVALNRREPPTDYFACVYAATHVNDAKSHEIVDEDDLREEREEAGPSLKVCPVVK